ncbi:uncharacterized protein LOC113204441 isoform X1 [Frankliniella occidentalis]|uniref:Uncharacterized protein LOC113204441 isoform X1 n=1 Tax=Frankliniella occidentalis TaxID=133901 RepID=A0A6J1S853_FRAOC|nr:uncharacterized protein LOC113204441 isoform X1 [Frankliniella occidentalis]
MKSCRTSLGTSKKTTVMANTIERDRSLPTGNHNAVQLHGTVARLANILEKVKNLNSEFIQLNTSTQVELQAIADAATAALQKFQSARIVMNVSIADVHQEIMSLCSELASVEQPSNLLASSSAPTTRTSSSPVGPNTSSVVASVHEDSSGTSTLTQGTACPMMQGQVISTNPTVPLQSLIVPVPLEQGPERVPPQHSNESSGDDVPSPRIGAPPQSISPSSQPMPESDVLLKHPLPASLMSSADPPLTKDDDDVFYSCGGASGIDSSFSPSRQSPVISESIRALSSLSTKRPAEHSSSISDETEAEESSSEDENVALHIVESKKSDLERQRQEDCKEGTSWNYDDAGKFHESQPRKRRSKRAKSPTSLNEDESRRNSFATPSLLNLNISPSALENIESTPTPNHAIRDCFVALERLPSNIISGNPPVNCTDKKKKCTAPEVPPRYHLRPRTKAAPDNLQEPKLGPRKRRQ